MNKKVIAIGFFDGVHKGHQALMDKACTIASKKKCISSVFTFKKHPDTVVFGNDLPLITSDNFREEVIKKYGNVDEVYFWDFDIENSKISAQDFVINILFKEHNACHIITGEDFTFGYKGLGNADLLEKLCYEHNIGYDAIKRVYVGDTRVSSTHIRHLLSKGDINEANKFLAHTYEITGEVIHGREVGRTLGIPTANIMLPLDIKRIPNGVYITSVEIDEKIYKATTNVGVVPTFLDQKDVIIEAHILDFKGDLYGKNLTIKFYERLRPEIKFESIDHLKQTILENIEQTKNYKNF